LAAVEAIPEPPKAPETVQDALKMLPAFLARPTMFSVADWHLEPRVILNELERLLGDVWGFITAVADQIHDGSARGTKAMGSPELQALIPVVRVLQKQVIELLEIDKAVGLWALSKSEPRPARPERISPVDDLEFVREIRELLGHALVDETIIVPRGGRKPVLRYRAASIANILLLRWASQMPPAVLKTLLLELPSSKDSLRGVDPSWDALKQLSAAIYVGDFDEAVFDRPWYQRRPDLGATAYRERAQELFKAISIRLKTLERRRDAKSFKEKANLMDDATLLRALIDGSSDCSPEDLMFRFVAGWDYEELGELLFAKEERRAIVAEAWSVRKLNKPKEHSAEDYLAEWTRERMHD
jgi:hypothetical protein